MLSLNWVVLCLVWRELLGLDRKCYELEVSFDFVVRVLGDFDLIFYLKVIINFIE